MKAAVLLPPSTIFLSNKIKTEITRRNREKRKVDRMSISIDTLIGDDENSTIGDMIADDFNIEKEYTDIIFY